MSHTHSYPARQTLRLKDYDYGRAGMYFVTVCTLNRAFILGMIEEDTVALSEIGHMVYRTWMELPLRYSGIDVDAFVVMPNHVHGIVVLGGVGEGGEARGPHPTMTLSQVVHRFKSFTTFRCRALREAAAAGSHAGKLWQRNFYEHVIRDEADLTRVRQYIQDNPLKWCLDAENPDARAPG
jgi:REP element-mobilizing transposase RayT